MSKSVAEIRNQERWYQQAARGKARYLILHGLRIGAFCFIGGVIGAYYRNNAFLTQALPQILVFSIGLTGTILYDRNRQWEKIYLDRDRALESQMARILTN